MNSIPSCYHYPPAPTPVYFCFGCKNIVPTRSEKILDSVANGKAEYAQNLICCLCSKNNIAPVTKQHLLAMSITETAPYLADRYKKLAETFG